MYGSSKSPFVRLRFRQKTVESGSRKRQKDRYLPLSEHLIRGLKKYIEAEKPEDYLFGMPREGRAGASTSLSTGFDSRYSQRGVQWAVKQASRAAKILKEVSVHTLRHSFATHLLEDGMDILSIKNLLGHESIDTTLVYLQIAQLSTQKLFSPLDTLFSEFGKK